jgi:hypothetical protein
MNDTTNTAARLEGVHKRLGVRICAGGSVTQVAVNFRGRPVAGLMLRGKTQTLPDHMHLGRGSIIAWLLQKARPLSISKCSTIGPSAKAGK